MAAENAEWQIDPTTPSRDRGRPSHERPQRDLEENPLIAAENAEWQIDPTTPSRDRDRPNRERLQRNYERPVRERSREI